MGVKFDIFKVYLGDRHDEFVLAVSDSYKDLDMTDAMRYFMQDQGARFVGSGYYEFENDSDWVEFALKWL